MIFPPGKSASTANLPATNAEEPDSFSQRVAANPRRETTEAAARKPPSRCRLLKSSDLSRPLSLPITVRFSFGNRTIFYKAPLTTYGGGRYLYDAIGAFMTQTSTYRGRGSRPSRCMTLESANLPSRRKAQLVRTSAPPSSSSLRNSHPPSLIFDREYLSFDFARIPNKWVPLMGGGIFVKARQIKAWRESS